MTGSDAYLYDTEMGAYAMLDNDVAVQIIRLCDGTNTVESICRAIAESFDADLQQITEDVTAMVATLEEGAFLEDASSDHAT